MINLLFVFQSFIEGLATLVTAVCVLPLYPGYISYLANKASKDHKVKPLNIGLIVGAGAITFMLLFGILFSTILQLGSADAIQSISPYAFGLLVLISLGLIFNVDISRFIPKAKTPTTKYPKLNAFLMGFFFGAIMIPCNAGFAAAFLVRTATIGNFLENMTNFLAFGIGIVAPLILLSALSQAGSNKIINAMTKYKRHINLVAGIIMLGISVYYLIFVFRIFG